jgi:hypothetical protein
VAMMDVATWQNCIFSIVGRAPDCHNDDLKSSSNTIWMTLGLASRSSAVQVQQLRILWLSISASGVFERYWLGGMRMYDIVLKLVPALRPAPMDESAPVFLLISFSLVCSVQKQDMPLERSKLAQQGLLPGDEG